MFSKYNTVDDIPEKYFEINKIIEGRVHKVLDGDTIRVSHKPFLRPWAANIPPNTRKISDITL